MPRVAHLKGTFGFLMNERWTEEGIERGLVDMTLRIHGYK